MNRSEIFAKAYPGGVDAAPMFEAEYQMLQDLWEEMPEECRDMLLELPPTLEVSDEPDPKRLAAYDKVAEMMPELADSTEELKAALRAGAKSRAAHVRAVDQRYRYRMANEFAVDFPDIFRRVMLMADDVYALDLLFFGTIGALSACLPGVKGSLDREVIQPNLFIFVTGNAASGKGLIGRCRKLLEPLDKSDDWMFLLPANSSDTAIYAQLADNGGRGILFETEADTLSAALGKASGKFGDGLRKAFHNETICYMRRTNNEQVVITDPVLSVILTGTPRQLSRLIKDPEDGLFSRFLFYRLMAEQESFAQKKEVHRGITGEMVNDYMEHLGQQVKSFYYRLEEKARLSGTKTSIRFALSEEQEKEFLSYFNKATTDYQQLFFEGYQDANRAGEAVSIMRRMGNICYRMMMVLTVSRLIGDEACEIPDEVVCDQRDFDQVMAMEPTMRFHNHLHYDEMLVNNGVVPPMEEENSSSGDMLTSLQRRFYEALPSSFTRKVALQVAENLSKKSEGVAKVAEVAETPIPERTITRYLARYCELGILTRLGQGKYEKVKSDDTDAFSLEK